MIQRQNNLPGGLRRALPALLCALSAFTPFLAADAQGSLRLLGDNRSGQAGNGVPGGHSITAIQPTVGPLAYIAVSSGGLHSMAIAMDQRLWIWGSNQNGQLGDSTLIDQSTPQPTAFSNAIACAAGFNYSMALQNNGLLYTWGNNDYGQLGIGPLAAARPYPAEVQLDNVTSIAAGIAHSAAITNSTNLYVWGDNTYGQVGDGSHTQATIPRFIMSGVYQVACGLLHTVVVKNDGTVWEWGNNTYGQLGRGFKGPNDPTPRPVPGLTDVYHVEAGDNFVLAAKNDGTIWAWGNNEYGQLGLGNTTDQYTPARIYGLSGVAHISARNVSSAVLLNNGSIYGWGDNSLGQLGTPYFTTANQPTYCFSCNNALAISMGDKQMMALIADLTAVAGHITLEGISASAPTQQVSFEVRPDSAHPAYTLTADVDASGNFGVFPVQFDTGTLHIKGAKYLATNLSYDTRQGVVSDAAVTLRAADANDDNSVDTTDFGVLVGSYNSSLAIEGSGYDVRADFNLDGSVDATDFGLLVGNYGSDGDL